ncbi:MAG TPA: GGDEF domain-containing protein [Stellaceae bacterium]|nr:GGDEF domain-containing protein [Stellaceae bacterium]
MEIRDTRSSSRVASLRRPERAAGAAAAYAAAARPADAVELAGLPEAEITPKVRQALLTLLAEVDQLRRDLGEARKRIDFLERLADEDPMIPVANRRAFLREVTRMIAIAQRYGAPASIVYLDVNDLKMINDAYGHAAGDAALVQISRTLVENVRNSDVVARLGGDEFGVLLMQSDKTLADAKALQLAEAVRHRPLMWQGRAITLQVAYGVHAFSGEQNAGEILDSADRAMYERKREHRRAGSAA